MAAPIVEGMKVSFPGIAARAISSPAAAA